MTYDVVIVGGGAAGLSAALMLVRSRRSVVVIDDGRPRNLPAAGVHGFLTRDGMPPRELVAAGRAEASGYGAQFVDGTVTAVRPVAGAEDSPEDSPAAGTEDGLGTEDGPAAGTDGGTELGAVQGGRPGFEVDVAGRTVTGRRLVVAAGVTDDLPDVPGLRERWGRDVLHCPYCHGFEVRDQAIGVLGTGEHAIHQALLFRQLSESVVLLAHTAPPDFAQSLQLAARGIRVVTGTVAGLEIADDRLVGVHLAGGPTVPVQALAVTSRLNPPVALLEPLGVGVADHPSGAGGYVPADPTGRTEVPGVWVTGSIADPMAQVVMAAAAGARTGAAVNADLVAEDTALAVARHDFFTQEFWDDRYRSADRIWSGDPNPHLVATAADLPPGDALDVGAGEGADAVWLATRGWTVTGVDVSEVALGKAAEHARTAGVEVTWERADIRDWRPSRRYDLVSAHFMHFPKPVLAALHRSLAEAVRPGGTLLIVGHHPDDLAPDEPAPDGPGAASGPGQSSGHGQSSVRGRLHELMFTAEERAAGLDPGEWDVRVASPCREVTGPDGTVVTRRDAVLRAVRRTRTSSATRPPVPGQLR